MVDRQLKVVWILGILLCLILLTTHVQVHMAKPVVIQSSGDLQDLDITNVVKENIPDIKMHEPPGQGESHIALIVLILAGLTWYTFKRKQG